MSEWDESQHPRDASGKFGAGGSLGLWVQKNARRFAEPLLAKAERTGGFSYKPGAAKGERVPTSGIMVSRAPTEGLGHVIEIAAMADREPPPTASELRTEVKSAVSRWLAHAIANVKSKDDHYLGGWIERDKTTKAVVALHLDVSQRFATKDKAAAIQAGKDRNQDSVWHIEKGEEIPTGGTGR